METKNKKPQPYTQLFIEKKKKWKHPRCSHTRLTERLWHILATLGHYEAVKRKEDDLVHGYGEAFTHSVTFKKQYSTVL